MNLLNETIQKIRPLDQAAKRAVEAQLDTVLETPDALGCLKEILLKYAGITGETALIIPEKYTVVACADHGVAELKLSAYPMETTVQMTKNYLLAKGAVANALTNFSGAQMIVVDMGIAAPMDQIPGLINRKIAYGTKNCTAGAAMTRPQAIQAIETGIELADTYARRGCRCFLPGEMGIANTTSSAAIVATLCDLPPEQATGRGTNISDERLKVKIAAVRQALAVNRPDASDGLDVLAKVGGFELGCIVGIILGAAANRAFVVLDGFNTGAAALIAAKICPLVQNYLMGSHLAAEPAHQKTLETLGLRPYMDLQFRLGEATGSSIAVNFLDAMIKAYQHLFTAEKSQPLLKQSADCPAAFTAANLATALQAIQPLDAQAMDSCRFYIDNLTKPLHSLGALEALAVKIAGITACAKPPLPAKSLLRFHPVKADSTEAAFTAAFAAHAAAAVVNVELQTRAPLGSADVLAALTSGWSSAQNEIRQGAKLLGFCGATPATTDAAFRILQRCARRKNAGSPLELLQADGTAELAAMVGAILSAASARGAVLPDDFPSQLAAYLAAELAPRAKDYIILTEYSPCAAHQSLQNRLGLPSYLDLKLKIGSGSVSALGMKLTDAAMHMLNDMKTFADAAVAVADDGPGAERQREK